MERDLGSWADGMCLGILWGVDFTRVEERGV